MANPKPRTSPTSAARAMRWALVPRSGYAVIPRAPLGRDERRVAHDGGVGVLRFEDRAELSDEGVPLGRLRLDVGRIVGDRRVERRRSARAAGPLGRRGRPAPPDAATPRVRRGRRRSHRRRRSPSAPARSALVSVAVTDTVPTPRSASTTMSRPRASGSTAGPIAGAAAGEHRRLLGPQRDDLRVGLGAVRRRRPRPTARGSPCTRRRSRAGEITYTSAAAAAPARGSATTCAAATARTRAAPSTRCSPATTRSPSSPGANRRRRAARGPPRRSRWRPPVRALRPCCRGSGSRRRSVRVG